MSAKRILKIAELFLKFNGFFLEEKTWFPIINFTIGLTLFISFIVLCLMGVVENWDSDELGLEGVPLTLKVIVSLLLLIYQQKLWRRLIKNASELNLCETLRIDERGEIDRIIKFCINFTNFYVAENILALILFYLNSVYTLELPLLIYTPCNINNLKCTLILFFFELAVDFFALPVSLGLSLLFIYITLTIICQLEAVKCLLRRIDANTRNEEIKAIFQEHNRALEVCDDFRNIARNMFLINYMASTFTICAVFYMLNRNGFPPLYDDVMKYFPIFFLFVLEFYIYAYGATKLTDVIESVGDEAYASNWTDNYDVKLRKSLILLIEKSQTTKRLTIGGIQTLDLNVFVVVMQNAFSFYTLMMNLGDQ